MSTSATVLAVGGEGGPISVQRVDEPSLKGALVDEQHFRFSTFREKLIEHLLIGELLRLSWLRGECSLEVAKPEVDSRGYDVIIERNGIVRHLQLKASSRDAAASGQKVPLALAEKPSGCVLWVMFDRNTLALGPFLFFGSEAGRPLPAIGAMRVARHSKGNAAGQKAARPDIRVVPKSRFAKLDTLDEVFNVLFDAKAASCADGAEEVGAIEKALHELIRRRLSALSVGCPNELPSLARPFPDADAPAWFPVPGMYGGFSYWGNADGSGLVVESWSRVVLGSGERHEVRAGGVTLVERGFV